MVCPKCKSNNVNVQMVTEQKRKHHSILYWIFIGWWLEAIMWIFLTFPRILIALFSHKPMKSVHKSMAVCQDCGYHFEV